MPPTKRGLKCKGDRNIPPATIVAADFVAASKGAAKMLKSQCIRSAQHVAGPAAVEANGALAAKTQPMRE